MPSKKKNNPGKEQPTIVSMTANEAELLKERLVKNTLTEDDKSILEGLISAIIWMQVKLRRSQLTILRLKKFFGFKTEKAPEQSPSGEVTSSDDKGSSNGCCCQIM
ncbi:MAG: hypothetical protein GY821_03580 [Gammaproteobacteria bacterium]|nr:hypothetical protein [Gammaproteobacteria bacterium]